MNLFRLFQPVLGLIVLSSLIACKPDSVREQAAKANTHEPVADYQQVARALSNSCMPCHNKQTLGQVIERVKTADFAEIDGETRLRILGELQELQAYMDEGVPISFTSQEQVDKFMRATPGEFYMMLEKGVMPPPWAHELMEKIDWPNYQTLKLEDRVEMLKYAKPFSQKYLR